MGADTDPADDQGFSKKSLLQRDFTIELSDGDEFTIIAHTKSEGDSLLDGEPMVKVQCVRIKQKDDRVLRETIDQEYLFPTKESDYATLDHYVLREGDKVAAGKHLLLRYSAKETFENLISTHVSALAQDDCDLHAAPKIPKNKLNNAIASYASNVDPDRVLFLYDDTIFGSAKEGYIITDSGFYYKASKSFSFRFNDIANFDLHYTATPTKEEPEPDRVLKIDLKDETSIEILQNTSGIDIDALATFLKLLSWLNSEGLTKEVDGYIIVEAMPDPVKLAYAKLLVWMTYEGDGVIDEREIREIQILMTQLDFGVELRQSIRSAIYSPSELSPQALLSEMMALTPTGSEFALKISLLKDSIRIHRATSGTSAIKADAVCKMAERLELNDQQLALLDLVCEQDEQILSGDLSDEALAAKFKDISERASTVGVPMAAVYLSGSVTGLSAGSVTNGLAGIGLASVLGLSSLASGVGVFILLGVGAYHGFKFLSSNGRREQGARRELMLQEVMRNHQRTISNLAEDIAFFGRRMAELIEEVEKNKAVITSMSREMAMFANALTQIREREASCEQSLLKNTKERAA